VLSLRSRFALQSVFYDPWQGLGLAQRLTRQGIRMTESLDARQFHNDGQQLAREDISLTVF
jgi:hypothetical protein